MQQFQSHSKIKRRRKVIESSAGLYHSLHSDLYWFYKFLKKYEHSRYSVFLSTSQWKSCDVTVAFTFCLVKYSQRCLAGLRSDGCEGKATACQHSLLFTGLQTDLALCHRMFRAIVLLENESSSTQFQAGRDGMPLKKRVVLSFGQCVVHCVHISSFWKGKTSPHLNIATIIFVLRMYIHLY